MLAAHSGVVTRTLASVKADAVAGVRACEAFEVVDGYLEQLRKAGHTTEAVPDYSVDYMPV